MHESTVTLPIRPTSATSFHFHPRFGGGLQLKAHAGWTSSFPLTIEILDGHGISHGEIVIFTKSAVMTSLLAQAINSVDPKAAVAPALLEAAE